MNTQEDLYLEYARVITMVREYNEKHVADVKPWEGARLNGNPYTCMHPLFNLNNYSPDDWTFAIAILEGKPVFVGDRVWLQNCSIKDGHWMDVTENDYILPEIMSWTPPQKKPILEGREIRVNDVLFRNEDNPVPWIATETGVTSVKIIGTLAFDNMDLSEWSRLPNFFDKKKRTFMLNGVEFSSPIREPYKYGLLLNGNESGFWQFYFATEKDREAVLVKLVDILKEARDKA